MMRWEDERYIRVFVRDTPSWDALGWEAQALLILIFRKMDRTGVLSLGQSGRRALAASVRMPLDVVERALDVLLEDGVLSMIGNDIFCKNFMAAQECAKSDSLRSKEKRERAHLRLTQAVSQAPRDVAESPQGDTTAPRSDTPSVPCLPCCADPDPPIVPHGGTGKRKPRTQNEYSEAFSKAWKLYVRGEDKAGAYREWKKLAPQIQGGEEGLLDKISSALSWQIPAWRKSDNAFPNHQVWFTRYLSHRRWEDEKPYQPGPVPRPSPPQRKTYEPKGDYAAAAAADPDRSKPDEQDAEAQRRVAELTQRLAEHTTHKET